jgi:hypothetical protein
VSDFTDGLIYWAIIVALVVFISWLLLAPAPNHDPLMQFAHTVLVR